MAKSSANLEVVNLTALQKTLQEFPKSVRNRIIRKSVSASLTVVLKAIKPLPPRRYGTLKKSLGSRTKTYKSGVIVGVVGARAGIIKTVGKKTNKPTKYLHLVEGDTKAHQIIHRNKKAMKKPIEHPGTKGKRFMARGYAASKGQVDQILGSKMIAEIENEGEKLRRKNEAGKR